MSLSGRYKGFKWTVGDASNPSLALCVDNTSRQLHICEAQDADTDWDVAADTHPTVFVHSATAPATNYFTIDHDGTDLTLDVRSGNLKFAFDGTDEFTLTTSALAPTTSDGSALGTSSLKWSDIWLANGGVVNMGLSGFIASVTGNNQTFAIKVGTATGTTMQSVIAVSSATTLLKAELGFYGVTPKTRNAHIAAAVSSANASLCAVAVNSILVALETYGLLLTA